MSSIPPEHGETQALLVLNAPIDRADELIDWLLSQAPTQSFTSFIANGHGSAPRMLNLTEQVTGHQPRFMVQIQLPLAQSSGLLEQLRHDWRGLDLHYWLLPVLAVGHLA